MLRRRPSARPWFCDVRQRGSRLLTVLLLCTMMTDASGWRDQLSPSQEAHLRSRLEEFRKSDPDLRFAAIRQFAGVGDAAAPLLIGHLNETRNPVEIRACLLGLDRIGTPLGRQAVRNVVAADRLLDDEIALALLVLGRLGPGPELKEMREVARGKRPLNPRGAAVIGLGRAHDVEGLKELLTNLRKEPIDRLRLAVLLAAGSTRDRILLPHLLPFLKAKTPVARRGAVFAVGEMGDPSALPALLEALRLEKDDGVRSAIADALGRFEDPSSREGLLTLTRDKESSVRDAAWGALAARGDGGDLVAKKLGAEKEVAQLVSLAYAASSSRSAKVHDELAKLLSGPHREVRLAAGFALASGGVRRHEGPILSWFRSEKGSDREGPLLVIGVLGLDQAVELIRQEPSNVDGGMAEAVLRTLTGWRDVRLLRDDLRDRLDAVGARLVDRRLALQHALLWEVFDLDNIGRKVGPNGGGDSGGSDGGGFGKPRVDPRNTSLQRDLAYWFGELRYFEPPEGWNL